MRCQRNFNYFNYFNYFNFFNRLRHTRVQAERSRFESELRKLK